MMAVLAGEVWQTLTTRLEVANMDSVSRQLMMGGLKETLPGQQIFTASSIFVVPAGVTSISVVCVGRGSTGTNAVNGRGGGGGALAYSNNIVVFPGESLTVTLSSIEGEYSSVARGGTILVSARNASAGTGGGNGVGTVFRGGSSTGGSFRGGGGAAGYAGNGGDSDRSAAASSGGGAGGATGNVAQGSGGGGGVGLLGIGGTGTVSSQVGGGGGGGSRGGSDGARSSISGGSGGTYGGGGGGGWSAGSVGQPGIGAVRIIWPGNLRQFPSTRTVDE